eukprot:gene2883-3584_t
MSENENNNDDENKTITTSSTNTNNKTTLYQEGLGIWIPDQQLEWISADIIEYQEESQHVLVRTEDDREIRVPVAKVFFKNPDILEGVDDLSSLSHLHEAAILHNLHHRYNLNQIYTYIGKILIAINPYTSLPLYGREMISAYYGKQLGALSPHVYAVAEDAFKDMRYDGSSQSILVSGESGAGKTETTKFLLQYFAAMGNMIKESSNSNSSGSPLSASGNSIPLSGSGSNPLSPPTKKPASEKSIEERVLESTPLLEAFGNAKTLRNDNSSRFGKFIEIHFNEYGSIIGAKILTYLLEKSRIVRQVYNERNYHIFYQLLAGANQELREKLYLENVDYYNYLNQSGCYEIDGVSDEDQFHKTCHAMTTAGVNQQDQENVFRILSVVMLLGNVTFEDRGDDSSQVGNQDALNKASELLGCSADELGKTFLTRKVVTGKESFITTNTKERAENARDSLTMFLYGMMFDWLVVKINSNMSIQQKSKSFIGVLDIYGFESFEVNGFEQFCINYANEKLQQLFNQHVFKEEQQEYIKEKIDWSYIDFNDNQDTLDLIEKKPICILSLLDEETVFPKSTPQTLATKFYSKLTGVYSKFEKPRFSNTAFTINHYAGKVTYETDQFLDKNKDFIIPEQILVLQKSQFPFIKILMSHSEKLNPSPGGPGAATPSNRPSASSQSSSMKFLSVGSQFSSSLATLMKTISTTTPHYIRCIKPNPDKLPQTFNKSDVIHQLRCGGVMESVRICCAGFPTRRPLADFFARYKILDTKVIQSTKGNKKIKDPKLLVQMLLEGIKLSDDKYKIGITKVFLRAGQLASLENLRMDQLNHSATVIQKNWKRYYYYKRYQQLRRAALIIQTKFRSQIAKQNLSHLQRIHAAIQIQKVYRGYRERVKYQKLRNSALLLQCSIRRALENQSVLALRYETSSLLLQTHIRTALACNDFKRKLRGIIRLQAKWRGKMARKLYSSMRAEARSLRSVQEAKNKLQEKLEEMQWRLQTESKRKQQIEESKAKVDKQLEELLAATDRDQLKISELEDQCQQLSEKNQSISAELSEATRQVNETAQSNATLLKNQTKLEKDVQDLQQQNQQFETTIQQLETERNNLLKQVENLTEISNKQSTSIEQLTKDLEHVKSEREKESTLAFQESVALKKQNQSLEEECINLGNLRDSLERSLEQLQEESEEAKNGLEQLKAESEDKYSQLTAIKLEVEGQLFKYKETAIQLEQKLEVANQRYQQDSHLWKTNEDQLKQQLGQLLNQCDELKSKLSQKDSQMGELQEKYKKLKSKLEGSEEHQKSLNNEFERYKMSKHVVEEEKNSITNQLQSAKSEITQHLNTIQHNKEKISSLKQNVETNNKEINKLSNDLRSKEDQLNRLNLEIQDLKSQSMKQSKELADMSSTLQIEKSKSDLSVVSLEKLVDSTKIEIERHQSTIKQNERDMAQYRDTIAKQENEIKQLTQLKERFENEFFVAKEKNSNNDKESMYLKEVTSQMQQTQSRLEKELEEKKQQIQRMDDERDNLKKQISQLTASSEQSSTQLIQTQMIIEQLKKKKSKSKEKLAEVTHQMEQLNNEIASLKAINNSSLKDVQNMDTEKKRIKEKLSDLKSQIQTLRETSIRLETEATMSKNHSAWLETSHSELKSRNQELQESINTHKIQVNTLQTEVDRLTSQKDRDIVELKTRIEELTAEKEKANARLAELRNSFESEQKQLREENTRLIKENKDLEENSLSITNHMMNTKLENDKLKQDFERKLIDEEKKSKRMSIEIQQQMDDAKTTQQQEITQLRKTIEELRAQLSHTSKMTLNEQDKVLKENEMLKRDLKKLQQGEGIYERKYHELALNEKMFHQLQDIISFKENEWERLARLATNGELETKLLSDYLLSCKLEHTILAGQMWYHQLDYWRAFDRENSSTLFRGIIRSTLDFTRIHFEDMDLLSYLLACSSLLVFLYQNKLSDNEKATITPVIPTIADLDEVEVQIDTETKPMEFLKHLQATVGRTYGLLFRIVTSKLTPLIDGAILNENYNRKPITSTFGHVLQQPNPLIQIEHITSFLFSIISVFQHRMIHFTLSQQFFNQIFCWIGAIILKLFMLRQTFCTESFAVFVRDKIGALTKWANEIGDVWVGKIDNAFIQVKEVISILMYKEKEKLVEEKIRKQICPTLNPTQLKQILVIYNPGEFQKRVSSKVINSICPPDKTFSGQSFVVKETNLSKIPIKYLHYFEVEDIKNLSIPASIRFSIESEIKNIGFQILKENEKFEFNNNNSNNTNGKTTTTTTTIAVTQK